MKAVCWYGKGDVRVEEVPEPHILNPRDIIVQVTTATVCGSDLHIYDGLVPAMAQGDILGHEFVGEVVEVGPEIHHLKEGDRVAVAFSIACGRCYYCQREQYSLCDNSNPNAAIADTVFGHSPAGLFGYGHLMGGYAGGQAEFVRVPYADVGALKIDEGISDAQAVLLSDVFPTGYQAAEQANIQPGDTVAVWGAGPVGLLAMTSARLLGAGRIIAIDDVPERLRLAREHNDAEVIDMGHERVLERLQELTAGRGPDVCIEAVGMEAQGSTIDALYDRVAQATRMVTGRPHALREAIVACRKGGTISIPGVYIGIVDKFPLGIAFGKGLTLRMGQTHVQKYMRPLLERMQRGEVDPSYVITHSYSLEDAPAAYRAFKERESGVVKAALKPRHTSGSVQLPQTEFSLAVSQGTPSQAEGERTTVEENLAEKGLGEQPPAPPLKERTWPESRQLPGQAEGEREKP